MVNSTPWYLTYRISRRTVSRLRTSLSLLGNGLVHFWLYPGELYHVRWLNNNHRYLEFKVDMGTELTGDRLGVVSSVSAWLCDSAQILKHYLDVSVKVFFR